MTTPPKSLIQESIHWCRSVVLSVVTERKCRLPGVPLPPPAFHTRGALVVDLLQSSWGKTAMLRAKRSIAIWPRWKIQRTVACCVVAWKRWHRHHHRPPQPSPENVSAPAFTVHYWPECQGSPITTAIQCLWGRQLTVSHCAARQAGVKRPPWVGGSGGWWDCQAWKLGRWERERKAVRQAKTPPSDSPHRSMWIHY